MSQDLKDIVLPKRLYKYSVKREFDLTVSDNTTTDHRISDSCGIRLALTALGLHDDEQENMVVFFLDARHCIKGYELITRGLLDRSHVHPREIFRTAIINGCAKIAIAHNHPSGDAEPSPQDYLVTERLIKASQILAIPIIDHCIIASNFNGIQFYSMQDSRTFPMVPS